MFTSEYYYPKHKATRKAEALFIACKDSRAKILQRMVDLGLDATRVPIISVNDFPFLDTVENLAAVVPKTTRFLVIDDIDFLLPPGDRTREKIERVARDLYRAIGIPGLKMSFSSTASGPLQLHSFNLGDLP